MLYATQRTNVRRHESGALSRRLAELRAFADADATWLTPIRRQARAAVARGSAGLEGYRVDPDRARDVVEARIPPSERAEHVVAGCALAMRHVEVLADDPSFAWSERLLLDLHFEACAGEPSARPGRWRTGPVWMTAPGGGPTYQAPAADEVPTLMQELVAWLAGEGQGSVVVRAAMAQLHLVAIQPFADGNGRLARILHSLVLARGGLLTGDLGSVDERFARDPGRYHGVLRGVLGDRYDPTRNAAPWVDYCLEAHDLWSEERLAWLQQAEARWQAIEAIVAERGLPDRLCIALEQSLADGADRSSYAEATGVATATASTDLRRALDAGLVTRVGRARHIHYLASDALRDQIAERRSA